MLGTKIVKLIIIVLVSPSHNDPVTVFRRHETLKLIIVCYEISLMRVVKYEKDFQCIYLINILNEIIIASAKNSEIQSYNKSTIVKREIGQSNYQNHIIFNGDCLLSFRNSSV